MTLPIPAGARKHLMPIGIATVAVVLLAANLRTAVNVVSAVLPEMRETLQLPGAMVGLLAALPPFCFAAIGPAGPALARKIGLSRTALLSIATLTVGQVVRSIMPGVWWLFAGSMISMAAVAMINVIMPSLVRAYFPRRVAAMTTAYTVIMAVVASATSFATIPFMRAFDANYQLGLGMWAVLSALAILPWLPALRTEPEVHSADEQRLHIGDLARSSKAWSVAFLFGMQSIQAYIYFGLLPVILTDGGMDEARASAQVGIIALSSATISLLVPTLVSRLHRPSIVPWILTSVYVVAYSGLITFPHSLTELWSALLGVGGGYFPFCLYIMNIRARTHAGVITLSSFAQSIGYLIAGSAVTLIGTIQGSARDWTWVIASMIVLCVLMHYSALVSVRKWFIEDDLPPTGASRRGRRPAAPTVR